MRTFYPRLLGIAIFEVFFPGRKYDFLTDFGGKPTAKTARTFCRSCFYCFPAAAAAVSAPLDARSSRSRADAFPMCGVFFFFTRKLIQLRQIGGKGRPGTIGRVEKLIKLTIVVQPYPGGSLKNNCWGPAVDPSEPSRARTRPPPHVRARTRYIPDINRVIDEHIVEPRLRQRYGGTVPSPFVRVT